jgi:hypothetical protein
VVAKAGAPGPQHSLPTTFTTSAARPKRTSSSIQVISPSAATATIPATAVSTVSTTSATPVGHPRLQPQCGGRLSCFAIGVVARAAQLAAGNHRLEVDPNPLHDAKDTTLKGRDEDMRTFVVTSQTSAHKLDKKADPGTLYPVKGELHNPSGGRLGLD